MKHRGGLASTKTEKKKNGLKKKKKKKWKKNLILIFEKNYIHSSKVGTTFHTHICNLPVCRIVWFHLQYNF